MIETTIIVAVIIGIVEAIKRTGYLDTRWSALVAVLLGVALAWFSNEGDLTDALFLGVVSGLMAAGLYSGTKAVVR